MVKTAEDRCFNHAIVCASVAGMFGSVEVKYDIIRNKPLKEKFWGNTGVI